MEKETRRIGKPALESRTMAPLRLSVVSIQRTVRNRNQKLRNRRSALPGDIRRAQSDKRWRISDGELSMSSDAQNARRDFQGGRSRSEHAEMPIRAGRRGGSETVPLWGHRAVVLAISP